MSLYNAFCNKYPKLAPQKDFEANFENNFGKCSESIPVPVSFILTMA
jgi:CRISPR/Cas system CSM-associated protein Csm4 (group 5 of RAMP superfamily)